MKTQRLIAYVLMALTLATCFGALAESAVEAPVDYAAEESWAYNGINPERPADLFLVCPTVDMGRNGNLNLSLTDEKTMGSFLGALNMERGIYEDSLTLYAPYYRQASFPVYSLSAEEAVEPFAVAYRDVRDAFLRFAEETGERPFVLAGFSQGADMVLRLMEEFFDDSAYQDRLIAAYCIGWRLTEDDVNAYPWLKPAERADDLGAIVCFSTESVDTTESLIVPAGVKTYSINPLNWRTDDTPATAAENLGACFTDYSGAILRETAALTGAYIDPARGVLKAPDIVAADYHNSLFPDGVYHLYDYQFFFRNLQQNVRLRVETYLEAVEGLEKAS